MLNEEKSASGGDDQKDLPKPDIELPKPEKDLPLPHPQMPEHNAPGQTEKVVSASTAGENANSTSQKKSRINIKLVVILLLIFFVILILGGVGYFILNKSTNTSTDATPTPEQVFCAQEAMLCPDGVTYVSRQAPDCEFAKCPEVQETPEQDLETTPAPNTPTSTSSPSLQ